MELRVLQYFLAVVREENISRAAEVLHITQPTLSRQIAQLEEELGTPLFIRGRRLSLTDAGAMLRVRAEEVVSLVAKIEHEFAEKSEVGGIISIGSGGLMALQTLMPVLVQFQQIYPRVRYAFYTNSAEYTKERLDQGLLDMGFLLEPVDVEKYDYIRMKGKERWGLLVPAGHPLAGKESISKEDLFTVPLITSGRRSVQKELETWLGEDWEKLPVIATYNLITNVVSLVAGGHAAALTIEGAANFFEKDRMVFRPLAPELAFTAVLAWKKFQPHFSAASQLLEYIKGYTENV